MIWGYPKSFTPVLFDRACKSASALNYFNLSESKSQRYVRSFREGVKGAFGPCVTLQSLGRGYLQRAEPC